MLNCLFISERSENYISRGGGNIVLLLAFLGLLMAAVCLSYIRYMVFSGLFSDSEHKSLNKFIYTLSFEYYSPQTFYAFVVLFVDKMTLQMFYDCFIYQHIYG